MTQIILPKTLVPGSVENVLDVQENFEALAGVINGGLDSSNLDAGAVTMQNLATIVLNALVPVGTVLPYGGGTAPSGYVLCDGSALSRSVYSSLFAVLGTSYGLGNGSSTFNLPDLRSRVPVGHNGSDSDADTMGEAHGTSLSHSHTISISAQGDQAVTGDGTHSHLFTAGFQYESGGDWFNAGAETRSPDNTGATPQASNLIRIIPAPDGSLASGTEVRVAGGISNQGAHIHTVPGHGHTGTESAEYGVPFQVINFIIRHGN